MIGVLIFCGQIAAIWFGVGLAAIGGFIAVAGHNIAERDLVWAGLGISILGIAIFGAAVWGIAQ